MATVSSPDSISSDKGHSPVSSSGPVKLDVESQNSSSKNEATTTSDAVSPDEDAAFEDNSNVPHLSIPRLFWFFFYNFGLFAWGGPVAQIALIKDRLVIQEKWITLARFQRVFSVYQILPGPEAAELCMFFGCLSAGRLGGIVAGLAFILPGFILMLLASYVYSLAGFDNKYFNASFRALQPMVAAMILRATHKIADHSVMNQRTRKVDPFLVIAAICTAINGALRINIFISLGLYGVIYTFISRRLWIPAGVLFVLQYVGYAIYVVFRGVPSPVSLALGIAKTPSLINLFVLGLVAGSLSFGGAYTAIPFVQVEAVLKGGWLTQSVFIDCIAIGNVLPAPLVIFATFVGFQGGLVDGGLGNAFAGAVIITLGMFFPCFLFTIAGHSLLEKLVRNKFLSAFFDGLCGAVVGVIAIIAAQILKSSVEGLVGKAKTDPISVAYDRISQVGPAAVLYLLALAVLYKFNNKYTALLLLISGAVAGQFIFVT
ncbi:chromate transporter-domain-containing protein [Leptodontidium sp. 2 PMI_412]|nr:chromate transporter-domain-containing protein [Leptodontidium sp. MPI-SDFR-AT-0119]KAH9216589.1 chromate transporter-domain-containing protein [Leptodontidium sp. 2 PMI_412]